MARNASRHRHHECERLSEDNMEGTARRRKGQGMHALTPYRCVETSRAFMAMLLTVS